MPFYRVMAEITLLDDKEPVSEEGVDERIRYGLYVCCDRIFIKVSLQLCGALIPSLL